jgi:hypothetical protein
MSKEFFNGPVRGGQSYVIRTGLAPLASIARLAQSDVLRTTLPLWRRN